MRRSGDIRSVNNLPPYTFDRCPHCSAWRDKSERDKCCLGGTNILHSSVFPPWPESFRSILLNIPKFPRESRMLNNSSSFVSIGTACMEARRDELTEKGWVRPQGIPRMYGLYGRTYHYVAPNTQNSTGFYMFGCDPGECFSPYCDESLKQHLIKIIQYLELNNGFARLYKRVADLPQDTRKVTFKRPPTRIDEPFVAMGSNHDPECPPLRTFALHPKLGSIAYYSTMHRCGEAGAYPLFFPDGQGGWYGEVREGYGRAILHPTYVDDRQIETVHQYVKYMMYQHCPRITFLGTVAQQWTLDMFSRWQEIVFHFMASDCRVSRSVRMRLCTMKDLDLSKMNAAEKKGRPFAIPATVPGSPAARRKSCREAMAVISQLGHAHGWITATCNPRWAEISSCARTMFNSKDYNEDARQLPPELLAHIATRVYWSKYLAFLKLLRDGHFSFGRRTVFIQVVHEFQQRYFPHFHLLCRWENYDTLTEDQLDSMFCGRLFIYEDCPMSMSSNFDLHNARDRENLRKDQKCLCLAHKLHRVVFSLMRHTCAKSDPANCRHPSKLRPDGTCHKRFPRDAGTPTSQTSYTDGAGFFHPKRPFPEDAFVVPYNRLVLAHMMKLDALDGTGATGYFNLHNNWDQCAGAHTLEYVFEYQHKGPDFTELSVEEALLDVSKEFKEFQRLRHIGFVEALMRFLKMELVHNEPAVSEVSVHLENEQFFAVPENATPDEIRARLAVTETPLLRYFWRPPDLHHLRITDYFGLYDLKPQCPNGKVPLRDNPPHGIPSKFVVRRSKLHVCRLEFGSSMHVERYCLGLILRHFARSSFTDCLTVDGQRMKTFSAAAYELGIFSEYSEYEMCIQELINPNNEAWKQARQTNEAVTVVGPVWKARVAFVTIIMNGGPAQKLFDDYAFYLTRDAVTRGETTDPTCKFWLLQWTKKELLKNQLHLDDVGLEDPDPQEVNEMRVRDHEHSRVNSQTVSTWLGRIPTLDQYQRPIFDAIINSVMHPHTTSPKLFYVDARAGCGKTFLCQCISAYLRSQNKIVLTSAPSALAAALHMGGSTCHKCFGLPVTNDRVRRTSMISPRSYQGTALRICDLIIIDEFSMLDVLNFDCADRVCRDVCCSDAPFAGKVVLCCGEFAQLPPVVPNGLRRDIITASTISHPLWSIIRKYSLHHRWRSLSDLHFQEFCDSLTPTTKDGFFDSPKFLPTFRTCNTTTTGVQILIDDFKNFPKKLTTRDDFTALANTPIYASVVAAYHHTAALDLDSNISNRVRTHLNEPEIQCYAVDTATKGTMMTPEFMEELANKNHQIPPSTLRIFRGSKVRLLRNFHPSRGLCNGTILLVHRVGRHFLEAQIISDTEFNGQIEILFRFKFEVESKALTFSRIQFPIASAFAGTVHRFQGQSVPEQGFLLLDIRRNPFCHGQGYVAFSRARKSSQVILITLPGSETAKCLIYKEFSTAVSAIPDTATPHTDTNLQSWDSGDVPQNDFTIPPDDDAITVPEHPFSGSLPIAGIYLDHCDE